MVRERWSRTVKNMLLEGEQVLHSNLNVIYLYATSVQDIQERYDYQKSLLEYVIKLGVKDKKEIRWKEVAPVFSPKTSIVLVWN